MGSLIYYGARFLAKVLDNALSTTKTILIQRSRWLLAGIAVVLSDFIYFWLTKRIVSGDNNEYLAYVNQAADSEQLSPQGAFPRGGRGHESALLPIQGEGKEGHRPLRPVPILLL